MKIDWRDAGDRIPEPVRNQLGCEDVEPNSHLSDGKLIITITSPWEGERVNSLKAAGFVETTLNDPAALVGDLDFQDWTWYEKVDQPPWPQLFRLWRITDPTGVSGTGHVADGCKFADGRVVVRWLGEHATTTAHESMDSVKFIHCHGGATEIQMQPFRL